MNAITKSALFAALLSLSLGTVSQAQDAFTKFFGNEQPPMFWEATPPHHEKANVTTGPTGYTPQQIKTAYGFSQVSASGMGQIIAIVDAYGSPTLQADLNTFSKQFSLPQTNVAIYYPGGKPFGSDQGWALETSLDVEWAHAIAPGAQIVLVVARSASFTDLLSAVDYAVSLGAKQVSMSWGGSEFSGELSYDAHFNKAGVSFFCSSGDSGAGASWPAASPYTVGVGGTTLKLNANGTILSETAWSGSGGGVSRYETRPTFQNGWQTNKSRGIPDVSYVADPNTGVSVYISQYYSIKGWITVGGTSAGSPQWAALSSIYNGSRKTSVSGADGSIYGLANQDYPIYFRDVTSGNNGGYNAAPKYDYVTGLGSPIVSEIALVLGAF